MDRVKILVVEDEIIIADDICDNLEALGYEALEPAISYTEALERIKEERPDIAILDIQLSGKKTGIDIAKVIREQYDFPFIFLTSNADPLTVSQAKTVMPPAYLTKPFTKDDLYTSIEIALHNYSKKNGEINKDNLVIKDAFFIKTKSGYSKLKFKDVIYVQSEHVYVKIKLANNEDVLVRASLNQFMEKLDETFIRVHRSFVINLNHLDQFHTNSLILKSHVVPLGKKYHADLIQQLNLM